MVYHSRHFGPGEKGDWKKTVIFFVPYVLVLAAIPWLLIWIFDPQTFSLVFK